jgi:ABC-type branched-subunit amino acid transport system substrate-binding protein
MWISVAGTPIDAYSGAAQEFVAAFSDQFLDADTPIDPYAIFGGQAAVVMLDAIAASDGSRSSVLEQLFATEVTDGYLGTFTIDENGDPAPPVEGTIVQFTIYKATDKLDTVEVVTPEQATIDAALQPTSSDSTDTETTTG